MENHVVVSADRCLQSRSWQKQTHEQNHRYRITAERRERTELIAEEQRQCQAWLAATYEPPPFEAVAMFFAIGLFP